MAQVLPLRAHTFRIDNCIIDDYGAELGIGGIAIYSVLQRYADRTTGQCWPSVATIAKKLGISKNCVKKHLHHLEALGLIRIANRSAADGQQTSHLYTVHDPTQAEALRRRQKGGSKNDRGGSKNDLPPSKNDLPPGSNFDPKQFPSFEQETLTSVLTPHMRGTPCENPAHEHRSPIPGLQMCIECFRHWPVPLVASTPAGDTERHQHA